MYDASVAKPIFVAPDGNRSADLTGDVKIIVLGADTGGAVAVLEVRTSPDFSTPVHVHHVENEWFCAIEDEWRQADGCGSTRRPHRSGLRRFVQASLKLASSGTCNEAALKAVFRKAQHGDSGTATAHSASTNDNSLSRSFLWRLRKGPLCNVALSTLIQKSAPNLT